MAVGEATRAGEMIGGNGLEECEFRRNSPTIESSLRSDRFADFPVVAKGVDDAADQPTVLFADWPDFGGAGSDCVGPNLGGIFDDEEHAGRRAGEGFGAEVGVFGRLIGDPEFRAVDGKLRDDSAVIVIDPEQYFCTECGLVKLDGLPTTADRQEWRDTRVGGHR
jgi:hypothetical protein